MSSKTQIIHCKCGRPVAKVVNGLLEIRGHHSGAEHVTRIAVQTIAGMPVVVDDALEPDEIQMRSGVVVVGS